MPLYSHQYLPSPETLALISREETILCNEKALTQFTVVQ